MRTPSAVLLAGVALAASGLRGDYVPGEWPMMRTYDAEHLLRVALPLGGIGTGTISLGGRGELRDWMEIVDVPQKNVAWQGSQNYKQPFFALHLGGLAPDAPKSTVLLQGPVDETEYLHANGDGVPMSGFPRFAHATFSAAYPFGKVTLTDPSVPVRVELKAFNPLVPGDVRASSLPVAVLSYRVENLSDAPREVSVVGAFRNPVGMCERQSGGQGEWWKGAVSNRNEFVRSDDGTLCGIRYLTDRTDADAAGFGSMALSTDATNVTCRLHAGFAGWRRSILAFWRDFSDDGRLRDVAPIQPGRGGRDSDEDLTHPLGALSVTKTVPAHGAADFTFFLTWSFRTHRSWGRTENHYFREFPDAWAAARQIVPELGALEARTRRFVETLSACSYPGVVKEAALFNLSVLRSPTVFRLATGELMGWEGVLDRGGSCHGTCKHVWNYEQALPYLFGDLARTQRDVEFAHSMGAGGAMLFRTPLPLVDDVGRVGNPAADGQNGCIQKICREWAFSGDDAWLARHWPKVREALAFAWKRWDRDEDGVMEDWQHNTMDVNYIGPNPACNFWYLGALRAGAEMARAMGDAAFSRKCADLAERGAKWMDAHLFNGEYYDHLIYDPATRRPLADGVPPPDYQIGPGCMADQLIGQVTAFAAGFGPLADGANIDRTLGAIMKYNYVADFGSVVNYFRSYAFPGEAGLVNTAWPHGGEPAFPYPYYAEAWTGIEYGAASAMAWRGRLADAERVVRAVRDRYEGRRRNPFSEIECGHHYARSLAAWGLIPAWSGFGWDARTGEMRFARRPGRHFWATGRAWGFCDVAADGTAKLTAVEGDPGVRTVTVGEGRSWRARLESIRVGR